MTELSKSETITRNRGNLLRDMRNSIKSLKRAAKDLKAKADESMRLAILSRRALAQLNTVIVSENPCLDKMEEIIKDGMDDAGLKLNKRGQWEWRPRPTAKIIILTNESED